MKGVFVYMKVVILAGGFGTRISEESYLIPKPMINIGDKPIMWHIMKHYSSYGFNDFIICAGYKQHIIKEYFSNYNLHNADVTFDFTKDQTIIINNKLTEPWKVSVIDTGLNTMTGGRIKKIQEYIKDDHFFLTYGDGLSDVNLFDLLRHHDLKGKLVTMTTVKPAGRFGHLSILEDDLVLSFREKEKDDAGWVNGGFMVINKKIFDYIEGDSSVFEIDVLEKIAQQRQLNSYKHFGFWQCMDSMNDKNSLENLWETSPPWKTW